MLKIARIAIKKNAAFSDCIMVFGVKPYIVAIIKDCKGAKKVWTYDGKTFKAYAVKTGLTDGINTEILEGLSRGQKIVVDVKQTEEGNTNESQQQEASPFAPKRPGKKK